MVQRNPRVTVSFTREEMALINGRSGNKPSPYLKKLALADVCGDDQTSRQLYALTMTLNEVLSVLIDEAKDEIPDNFIYRLCVLRSALRELQRQAVSEQQVSIQEALTQLHAVVGGNRLSPLGRPASPLKVSTFKDVF